MRNFVKKKQIKSYIRLGLQGDWAISPLGVAIDAYKENFLKKVFCSDACLLYFV